MSNPNEPIWFNTDKKEEANADTYQTIKTNKVASGKNTTEVYLGTSPHKIMVCTPCHSDVSMHYCQAVLKFQQECHEKKYDSKFYFVKIIIGYTRQKFMCC